MHRALATSSVPLVVLLSLAAVYDCPGPDSGPPVDPTDTILTVETFMHGGYDGLGQVGPIIPVHADTAESVWLNCKIHLLQQQSQLHTFPLNALGYDWDRQFGTVDLIVDFVEKDRDTVIIIPNFNIMAEYQERRFGDRSIDFFYSGDVINGGEYPFDYTSGASLVGATTHNFAVGEGAYVGATIYIEAHEIGHVFGLFHYDVSDNIMHRNFGGIGSDVKRFQCDDARDFVDRNAYTIMPERGP